MSKKIHNMKDFFVNSYHLHMIVGFILMIIAVILIRNPIIAFTIVIIAGAGKELYDYIDYGQFDIWDMLFTILGGIIAYFLVKLISLILF